jgi:hypothetical protein
MALQVRRGTNAERLAVTPLAGELIFTTDTKQLYVGDGSTAGGITSIANTINSVLDDTTPQLGGTLDLNGNDITGTGNINITGTITATGNINLGDGAGSDVISVGGSISGHLLPATDTTWNLGSLTYQFNEAWISQLNVENQINANRINASLIADDSTVVFNAATSSVTADSVTGATVTAGTSTSAGVFRAYSQTEGGIVAEYRSYHDGANAGVSRNVRYRGTAAVPGAVQNGDQLFSIQWNGWDGTGITTASSITGLVGDTGTIGAGAVPGRLAFTVRNAAGATVTPLAIDETSTVNFAGATVHQNANALLKSASAVQGSRVIDLQRTRGNLDVPVTVNSNDHIYTLRWQAYDGTSYTTSSQIRAEAESVNGAGQVPGRIRFMLADSTGNIGTSVILSGTNRTATFNSDLIATRSLTVAGAATFENVSISQNNISSVNSNSNLVLSGSGIGTVQLDVPQQLTVGAAGPAAAVPATPSTYIVINVDGSNYAIPAFAVS